MPLKSPAGENGVRIASPITAGRRAAGRGGSGAQFGFKKSQSHYRKGDGKPRFAKEPDLDKAVKKQRAEMGLRRRSGDPFYAFGTSRGPIYASKAANADR